MPNIPIVMYHSINDHLDESPLGKLAFTSRQFRQHLRFFQNDGFTCITLDELYRLALAKELNRGKFAVLTFDDGFLDNLTVASELLREFGAKGTVFVNVDQTAQEQPDRSGCKNDWGRLAFPELKAMEQEGTLSIQSHTLTHDFAFCSDKVIDFYSRRKRGKYYWLGCLLFPGDKLQWMEKFDEHAELIPDGYPIFEFDRTLITRKFTPDQDFVKKCVVKYSPQGAEGVAQANQDTTVKGFFESDEGYRERARDIVRLAKEILEAELRKEITCVCFPGGKYNDYVLNCARECGHRLYIFSSSDRAGNNNYERLKDLQDNGFVGLRRMSLTTEQPGFLKRDLFDYYNCKWHVDLFMAKPYAGPTMNLAKKAKSLLKLW